MTDLRRVVGYGTHKKRVVRPASSRAPLSARTFDTVMPFSPRYPKFEPIKYRRRKEKQSARKQVEVLEHGHIDHSALPREIQEFNKQREEKHWARAAAARRKNLDLEEKLKHEDAMLNMNCPARGKVHKLRKKGLPIVKEHWRLLNFVLSEDGDLVHDNEEPGGAPVTLGNLSSVIKIQQRTFDLFPVGGVELVFKYRNADGGRTHECLYLAWGDAEAEEYTFWMDVLKRYTWRCEGMDLELLTRPVTEEEEELRIRVEERFRADAQERASRLISKWYKARRTQRELARRAEEDRLSHLGVQLRLEYLQSMLGKCAGYGGLPRYQNMSMKDSLTG